MESKEFESIFDQIHVMNFSFQPGLDNFNKPVIMEKLEDKYGTLLGSREGGDKNAKVVIPEKNELYCNDHRHEVDDDDRMRYLNNCWDELKCKINDMEKDFIKAQLIYAFYDHGFKRMINKRSQNVIEGSFLTLKKMLIEFSCHMDNTESFASFKFVSETQRNMVSLKADFFKTFGEIWTDAIANQLLLKMHEDEEDLDLNYTSSSGISKSVYEQEHEFSMMPGETRKNLDSIELTMRKTFSNTIENISTTERSRFSELIQRESERWMDNQDTLLGRHQDFLFKLRDYHSWSVRNSIDEYLEKYKCSRRTWCPDLALENAPSLEKLLKEHKLIFDTKLDKEFFLDLDLNLNYYEVHSFLGQAKFEKMPVYKKLNIYPVSKLTAQGFDDFSKFLFCSTPEEIDILSICGGDFIHYDKFQNGLPTALKYVREQLYLANLILDSEAITDIIAKSHKVREIMFASCKFLIVNTDDETIAFPIKIQKLHFELKKLYFFGEYPEENGSSYKIDVLTLSSIFSELSKTNLRQTLEVVGVDSNWIEPKTMKQILSEFGFSGEIQTMFPHKPK